MGTSWPELHRCLAVLGYRAAVVGPEGHGKSSLLGELARQLEAEGWRVRRARVEDRASRLPRAVEHALTTALGPRDLVVVDGADALPRWAWLRLAWRARRAGGLLITRHGTGPLPELHRCRTSPALLAELVGELVGDSPPLPLPALDELFARHAGNLREALFALYDHCARLESPATRLSGAGSETASHPEPLAAPLIPRERPR